MPRLVKPSKSLTPEEKGREFDRFFDWMERKDIRRAKYEAGEIPCPYKWKYELADWYQWEFGGSERAANRMSKKQLFAIWYKTTGKKKMNPLDCECTCHQLDDADNCSCYCMMGGMSYREMKEQLSKAGDSHTG